MVTLPQTAPGVPAAGIDPTVEDLQQIGDVQGILSWLGSGGLVRTALNCVWAVPSLLRVTWLFYSLTCGRPPFVAFGFHKGKPQRGAAPEVRCFARQRLGLTPHDEAKVRELLTSYVKLRGAEPSRPPGCGFRIVRSVRQEAEGSWQRKELPGPPSLGFWWASFRVCRVTLQRQGTPHTQRASLSHRLLG